MKINEVAKKAKKNSNALSATTKKAPPPPSISPHHQRVAVKIAEYLKQHAVPWLTATKNGKMIFYRGTRGAKKDAYALVLRQRVRPNRSPMDTSKERHDGFNQMIAKVGGVANRSNAAFVTSNEFQASFYGKVYVYIPEGEFHYTFGPNFKDWTHYLIGSTYVRLKRADVDLLKKYIWADRNLDKAHSNQVEVMIHSKYGLLIDGSFYKKHILPLLNKKK